MLKYIDYCPLGGGGNGSQGGPAGGGVRVFDVETSQEQRSSLEGHEDYIHDMDYCSQSNALVSASEDGTARIWDLRTKKAQVQVIEPSKHESLHRPKVICCHYLASQSSKFGLTA